MKRANLFKRLLCLVMVVAMLAGFALPASAADNATVTFEQVDNSAVSATIPGREPVELPEEEDAYDANDVVRVSIVLEKAGTIAAGYSTMNIAQNKAAMNYNSRLEKDQANLVSKIEKATKEDLDVVWNLTLAANIISANVKFGQIEKIEALSGVKSVVIETRYEPDVVSTGAADPNMATSGKQIGSAAAWAGGYTGAGSRIAIIDTGTDTDHQSFNAAAFEYSLAYWAGKADMSVEEYKASLDLLDASEIESVLNRLNAYERTPSLKAADLYINSKLAYGYNYVDKNLTVHHDNDTQGSHGSHVAGIAAANAYIPTAEGFANALNTVMVQGVAPDAQLVTMKVFGKSGGAYDSDYMAAIEDAIVLGCDAVNLSLGSGNPGMSRNSTAEYQAILDSLVGSGVVVAMSAGNSGYWSEYAESGLPYNYLDDVSMQTDGSPGSFTNSFAVASVDNDGTTGCYVTVGDMMIVYNEMLEGTTGPYSNKPFTTIAGDHEYVFIDGIGSAEDWAAVGEALEGKIALCSRGEISFFEKAEFAVEAGAIATFIYNNQAGVINMDLSDYSYTEPCASLTQAQGADIKAASTAVTDEAGNVLYYTGAMTVGSSMGNAQFNSEYYTMSSFSSWGVPGSLELKPEITAPGGSIYSINGVAKDGKSYEVMSGTSMASPQVAGMAAVMAQYVRESGLAEKTGEDARALVQSLLMSTAVPMRDAASGGNYYPVIQQGSGLANVGAATTADSYIMMDANATASYADGKVKAELGDDPDREGVYSFSFYINNLTDVEKTFALSADVFTQDAFAYSGILLMDTWTANLAADVTWTVDGKAVESGEELAGLDFNGDGVVNSEDGQILLDYATGLEVTLYNEDKADLDADGDIDSYDSYLFFQLLNTSGAVVPANGTAKVTVTIALSDNEKAYLDTYYTNGAYIEAYVYAESLSDAEGVEGTTHSIPVLAFYGNWSDASMFDKGSAMDYQYGLENRPPYLYQTNFKSGNYNGLTVTYAGDSQEYWFGGNPMVPDATYMPERNAISAVNGSAIASVGFASIRNAAESFYIVRDVASGGFYAAEPVGPVDSAYYYVNGGYWRNTYYTLNAGFVPAGIPENSAIEVGLILVPEYYVDYAANSVDVTALGEGAYLTMPMVVDNTAPTLESVSIDIMNNTLDVSVTDNQYVAAIALYDVYGEYLYTYEGSKADVDANATVEYAIDLAEVNGPSFLLQVYDYAMNTTTYEINFQIGEVTDVIESIAINKSSLVMQKGNTDSLTAIVYPVNASDRDVIWTTSNDAVVTVDENGVLTAVEEGTAVVTATAAADENVFATCNVTVIDINVDMNAVVWDEEGSIWYSEFNTTNLPNYIKLSPDLLEDAYIASTTTGPDGTIYAASFNSSNGTGAIYTMDPETYELTMLSDCIVQGLHIFYSDLTYVPGMFGTGALLGTYGPFVMAIDPVTGESIGIIDQYDSDLVGITTCYGSYDPDYNEYQDTVYVIQNDGTVIQEIYYGYDGLVVPMMYYFYGIRASMDSGVNVGDAWYFNSAYYDGEYLYWSAFDQNTENDVTLYAIDADYTGNTYTLGKFADSVWPIGGLHQYNFVNDAAAADAKLAEIHAEVAEKGMPEAHEIELVVKELPVKEVKATGSLNAVANYTAPVRPMSVSDVAAGEGTVTVTVTAKDATGADVESTNGVSTVTYDAESLVLQSILVEGDYTSVNPADVADCDGSVTFGYVDLDGIAAGETVATLIFEVKNTDAESVTVSHEEVNADDNGYDEVVAIEYPHLNTEVRDAVDATCTEDGYTGDTYCTDCGKLVAEGEVIPATGHTFGEWTVTTEPDCDDAGVETRYCADCDATETREVAALGHSYEAVVTAPTCTEGGYTTYTCSVCGDSYVADETEATGHTFGEWIVTTEPDCVNVGEETRYCADCDATETREVAALGHNYEAVVTDPTCTEGGYTTYTCSVCGDSYVADETEALGHSYESVVTAPTCTEGGYTTHTCTVCGFTMQDSFTAATGHTCITVVTAPTCTEAGYTTHTCIDCDYVLVTDEVEALGHTFGEWTETLAPTCTEAGEEQRECEVCGEIETQAIEATGHDYEAVVTAPTCTEAGYTTYTCCNCGDTYVADEVAALGHTPETVPGKDATCDETGLTEGEKCSVCDEVLTEQEEIPALGHKYVDVVTKPTKTEKGYTTHTCENCGHSYVDSYTDPTPDASADTGDAFSALWIFVMTLSLAGAAALVLNRKKFMG